MLNTEPVIEPIHIDDVREAFAMLGINLDAHLRSVHFSQGCIEVVQMSLNKNGKVQVAGDEVATVTVRIPVVYARPKAIAG